MKPITDDELYGLDQDWRILIVKTLWAQVFLVLVASRIVTGLNRCSVFQDLATGK